MKVGLSLILHNIQCFQNLEIHLLLTPGREHRKVFEKIPIIGPRRAISLEDILVTAKITPLEKKKRYCRPCTRCKGTRCEICRHIVTTELFRSFSTQIYCFKNIELSPVI